VADLGLNYQALSRCASAARRAAGELAGLGDAYPAKSTDSTIFGKLGSSSGLAVAVDDIEKMVGSELGHADRKLRGVERALDRVESNVRAANRASGAAA
jgi:hypothetical protein